MKPRLIWANLAVKDLKRTTKFYTDLGFQLSGNDDEMVSFTMAGNKFIINFFTEGRFKVDVNGVIANAKEEGEVIFSLSAESKEEVDQCAEEVRKIGGIIFSEPRVFQKGYTFGFCDPDGHRFNVLYWPGM